MSRGRLPLTLLPALVLVHILDSPPALAQEGPPSGAAADSPLTDNEVFATANRLFESARTDEDLEEAATLYGRLLGKGRKNGHLYYNLGNTHLRLGDDGRAILNFRRALVYAPDDPYAAAMLAEVRERLAEEMPDLYGGSAETPLVRTLFFWHFRLSFRERLHLLVTCAFAFWTLLAARLYTRLPFHRFGLGLLLLVSLAAGTSLAVEGLGDRGDDAVIVANEVEVRTGNRADSEPAIDRPVPSGVEVRILETRGQWHLVEFAGGLVGWIPETAVERVREG